MPSGEDRSVARRRIVVAAIASGWVFCALVLEVLIHGHHGELRVGKVAIALVAAAGILLTAIGIQQRREFLRSWRFLLASSAVMLAVLYAAVVGGFYLNQSRLLFVPVPGHFAHCPAIGDEDDGRDFDVVEHGGVRAYVRERGDARAWVVIFHGNAETACSAVFYARRLGELPLDFAVVEYPGYGGDSHDHATQAALLANATEVYDFVTARRALPVFSFGRSIGTGVATYLASTRPVLGTILISPYTSIVDVGEYLYPFLPVRRLARDTFPASDWARGVRAPALIVHGTTDHVIPIAIGRAQAANLGQWAHLIEYPGLGHGTIVSEHSPAWDAIRAFVRERLTGRR